MNRWLVNLARPPRSEEGRNQEARHLPHLPPQHGDAPPARACRYPAHPGAPRPRLARDDRALHARRGPGPARGPCPCPSAGPRSFASLLRRTSRSCASGGSRSRCRAHVARVLPRLIVFLRSKRRRRRGGASTKRASWPSRASWSKRRAVAGGPSPLLLERRTSRPCGASSPSSRDVASSSETRRSCWSCQGKRLPRAVLNERDAGGS